MIKAAALQTVPHLITANKGPLQHIESQILARQADIEYWFRKQWNQTPAPFYCSVDLRNSGFKLAPVDTNLFPAGFNNLSNSMTPYAIQALQSVMDRICPNADSLLLIPENHTRNTFYLENIAALSDIIVRSGYRVNIGSLSPDISETTTINLPSGSQVTLEPIHREGNQLYINNSSSCTIILNNDLSSGIPNILQGLEQRILPPPELGWFKRLKSGYFTYYSAVAREFAELVELDPWLIDPLMSNCGQIDFMSRNGTDCLIKNTDFLLKSIQRKYDEYGIDKTPYVFIKADAGTYGMGVMTVTDTEQIINLNRKQRTKMSSTKEGVKVQKVIIQEGVYTNEKIGEDASAEPVVYMLDHYVIGGFYRIHKQKSETESLNSPGMQFKPLAFAESCNSPDLKQKPDAEPNRFYAYGVVARLALLAAAREIADQEQQTANAP